MTTPRVVPSKDGGVAGGDTVTP